MNLRLANWQVNTYGLRDSSQNAYLFSIQQPHNLDLLSYPTHPFPLNLILKMHYLTMIVIPLLFVQVFSRGSVTHLWIVLLGVDQRLIKSNQLTKILLGYGKKLHLELENYFYIHNHLSYIRAKFWIRWLHNFLWNE